MKDDINKELDEALKHYGIKGMKWDETKKKAQSNAEQLVDKVKDKTDDIKREIQRKKTERQIKKVKKELTKSLKQISKDVKKRGEEMLISIFGKSKKKRTITIDVPKIKKR